jgi:cytochrome c553
MMNHLRLIAIALLLLAALRLRSQDSRSSTPAPDGDRSHKTIQPGESHQSDGERKFAHHCGRCHNSPEGFSPHISGTIVRHMRVRASLSKQDEQDILRFLNP